MTTTALDDRKNQSLSELFLWWFILAAFAAAALLLPATRAGAQTAGAGPLPAATPSDQPPASSRSAASALIGGKPNLSGTWTLNKDESDDPRAAMQQAGNSNANSNGGRGGMGGGVGGGGGWGGQRGGMGGTGGGGRRGQNGSGNQANNLSQLTIEQTATSAKVTGESGEVLAMYTSEDSSKPNSPGPSASSQTSPTSSDSNGSSADSSSTPPVAQWQGTQLVAVTPGRRQGSTTRTYELSPDSKQLYVTTKIDNPRFKNPVTFRLVYDPAQSGG
ncbi:MAG TPA: hypothetical protein VIH46_01640 [Candidatus Acidoferrales bacterium]